MIEKGAESVFLADIVCDESDELDDLETLAEGLLDSPNRFPVPSAKVSEIFGGAHSGAPQPYVQQDLMPPTDCLAFYLPFHYYHPTWWGVYLLFEGVVWLAQEIRIRSEVKVSPRRAIQAARFFLYYHEAFHHKTECFATRLELTHRKPFYKTGFERLYQKTFGTTDCLEEGLANAHALQKVHKCRGLHAFPALCGYVRESPPGYDQGVNIRENPDPVRYRFAEDNQNICLPHLPPKNPEIWGTAPHMFDGIANMKSRVNYILPRSSPLVQRLHLRPMLPPAKLVKKLKKLTGLQFERHGGNHDIYVTSTGSRITIPRHQRDLGPGLVRSILREAGLTMSLDQFAQS